jgi:hypothetical protein
MDGAHPGCCGCLKRNNSNSRSLRDDNKRGKDNSNSKGKNNSKGKIRGFFAPLRMTGKRKGKGKGNSNSNGNGNGNGASNGNGNGYSKTFLAPCSS